MIEIAEIIGGVSIVLLIIGVGSLVVKSLFGRPVVIRMNIGGNSE